MDGRDFESMRTGFKRKGSDDCSRNRVVFMLAFLFLLFFSVFMSCPVQAGAGELTADEENSDNEKREGVSQLLDWLEEQMSQGALTCEEDIRAAIALGEEKFGITIPEGMKNTLVDLMAKMQNLGLDPEYLPEQAQELYQEFGDEIEQLTDQSFLQMIFSAVKKFFKAIWNFLADFFAGLFD